MNDTQNQIAAELITLWARVPHLRMCQLISDICTGWGDNYYMSDETFLRKLREFVEVVDYRDQICGKPYIDESTVKEVARYENH